MMKGDIAAVDGMEMFMDLISFRNGMVEPC